MGRIIGLITARGGSKSIPRKNIKLLAGKPLIAWTIQAALQSHVLDRVIVSTEDEEIAKVSREWGAEVPFLRPAELAQDDSPHIDVVVQTIHWLKEHEKESPEYILLLQPTSPLRTAEDIRCSVDLVRTRQAIAVAGVCESSHHPYLCKRVLEDGTLEDFIPVDGRTYLRRQALPLAYALNGAIYLNRVESLLKDRGFLPEGTCAYIMPAERSLDVDTAWDFFLAELILRDQLERAVH